MASGPAIANSESRTMSENLLATVRTFVPIFSSNLIGPELADEVTDATGYAASEAPAEPRCQASKPPPDLCGVRRKAASKDLRQGPLLWHDLKPIDVKPKPQWTDDESHWRSKIRSPTHKQ